MAKPNKWYTIQIFQFSFLLKIIDIYSVGTLIPLFWLLYSISLCVCLRLPIFLLVDIYLFFSP